MKKKIMAAALMSFLMVTVSVFAHHPAADIVDDAIYTMIEEAVAQTPHADLVFDDMGPTADVKTFDKTTKIRIDSIGTGTNMIVAIILNYASKLAGDVTIVIEYENFDEASEQSLEETGNPSGSANSWSEWGRPLLLTITQVLPTDM